MSRGSNHNRPITSGDKAIYRKLDPRKARIDALLKIARNRKEAEPKRIWACETLIRDCDRRRAEKIYEEITGRAYRLDFPDAPPAPPTSVAERQADRDAARVKAIKEKQRLEKAGRGQRKVVDHNLEMRRARKEEQRRKREEERARIGEEQRQLMAEKRRMDGILYKMSKEQR